MKSRFMSAVTVNPITGSVEYAFEKEKRKKEKIQKEKEDSEKEVELEKEIKEDDKEKEQEKREKREKKGKEEEKEKEKGMETGVAKIEGKEKDPLLRSFTWHNLKKKIKKLWRAEADKELEELHKRDKVRHDKEGILFFFV